MGVDFVRVDLVGGHRLAICIFRITRSVCSPDLDVYVFAVSTTVTLRCARAGS